MKNFSVDKFSKNLSSHRFSNRETSDRNLGFGSPHEFLIQLYIYENE